MGKSPGEVVSIRTGIYGGAFDPPHEGHLLAARTALVSGRLDRVIFLPCADTPNFGKVFAAARDRVRMLELLTADEPRFSVSSLEAEAGRPVPTAESMAFFRREYPEDQLYFILGADKLEKLPRWTDARKLFSLCGFMALPRDGADMQKLTDGVRRAGADITFLPMREASVSSSRIQEALAAFRDPEHLPGPAAAYIAAEGLYHDHAMEERVQALMTEKRFRHTLGVRTQGVMLAQRHGLSLQKAALAALLHDSAKCLPFDEMKKLARAGGITDENLLSSPEMLHGPAGAVLAERDFGVTDPDVLNAIAYHTMGRACMSPLEMCIFVADATEPGRRDYPGLETIREKSLESLPAAVLLSLERTKEYVLSQNKPFNPLSEKTIVWLRASYNL